MKYSDPQELQSILKDLKTVAEGTEIAVPAYYKARMTTRTWERIRSSRTSAIAVFLISLLTDSAIAVYLGQTNLQRPLEHIVWDLLPLLGRAGIISLMAALVVFVRELTAK